MTRMPSYASQLAFPPATPAVTGSVGTVAAPAPVAAPGVFAQVSDFGGQVSQPPPEQEGSDVDARSSAVRNVIVLARRLETLTAVYDRLYGPEGFRPLPIVKFPTDTMDEADNMVWLEVPLEHVVRSVSKSAQEYEQRREEVVAPLLEYLQQQYRQHLDSIAKAVVAARG